MIAIARPINGLTINGFEYVIDEKGRRVVFKTEDVARMYLNYHGGWPDELIDEFLDNGRIIFEEIPEEELNIAGSTSIWFKEEDEDDVD